MGIMDAFKQVMNAGTAPAAQPAAPGPGNIPASAAAASAGATGPGTAPNGAVPATSVEAKPASPLDQFEKLWETAATPGDGKDSYFNVNLEALQKAAANHSFTDALTPEVMAAVATGGEAGVKAMMEAMNTVAQATYANSAFATTKIVEKALKDQEVAFQSKLPGLLKKHSLSDTLRTENPAFSHPAAQPVIKALESQLTTKYPNATASELRGMAIEYLSGLGAVFAPPKAEVTVDARTGKPAREETDWSSFI